MIFASAAMDDTGLGPPPLTRYDRRSCILALMTLPSLHRYCTEKSRPGKYSDSVKDPGGTDRISSNCLIQIRVCSGLVTANAPYEPAPFRIRHHSGRDAPNRRNDFSISP